MEKRLALTSGNLSGTPKDIIESLVVDYNVQYGENWTVETDITDSISIDVKAGDLLLSIFDELAQQVDAQWTIDPAGKIVFKTSIGENKTSGFDYQELFFDPRSPNSSNISTVEVTGTDKRISVLLASDGTSGVTKTAP